MKGLEPTLVVVDDPVGCVVPSPGVRVIGHLGRAITPADILLATRMINMGPQRAVELREALLPRNEPDYPAYDRKRARKGKQRMKGLRP